MIFRGIHNSTKFNHSFRSESRKALRDDGRQSVELLVFFEVRCAFAFTFNAMHLGAFSFCSALGTVAYVVRVVFVIVVVIVFGLIVVILFVIVVEQ